MSTFVQGARAVLRQPGFTGLLGANFVLGLAYSFVVPYMSMWGLLEVGMTPFLFGGFMTVTTLSAIVLSLWLARWSDTHVTRRTMLIVGSVGGICGYLSYAFIRDLALLTIIGCVALGVASVNFSQLFAHVREEMQRPENRGADAPLLVSILRVSFSLAWIAGPMVGAMVMALLHFEGIFVGAAALFGLFLAAVLRFIPHRPHPPSARLAVRLPLWRVLLRRDILAYFSAFVLVFAAHTMSLANLPLMVTQTLGGTTGQVGIIFGIAPVIEVPLMVWFGRLAAAGHTVALIRLGVFMSLLYFVALSFADAAWQIYPMQALTAISIAITTNVSILFFQDLLPGQAGVATSIYSNSFTVGSLVGYLSFGLLLPYVGHRGIFGTCAVLCAVASGIVLLHRGGRAQPRTEPAEPLSEAA